MKTIARVCWIVSVRVAGHQAPVRDPGVIVRIRGEGIHHSWYDLVLLRNN